jgi:hypothetical protein
LLLAAVPAGDAVAVPAGELAGEALLADVAVGLADCDGDAEGSATVAVAEVVAVGEAPERPPVGEHADRRTRVASVVEAMNEVLMRYMRGNRRAMRHGRCTTLGR